MKTSILTAAFLVTTSLFSQNLIQNGSFESFDKDVRTWSHVHFDAWQGVGEVWTNKMGRIATDGQHKLEMDASSRESDALSQTIETQEGVKYLFSVDAYARKAGTSDFELLVDGEVILKVTPGSHWQKYGATFIGKGGQQTITLRELESQNNGYGAIIDNVMVQSDIVDIARLSEMDRAKYEILEPRELDQISEIINNDRKLNYKVASDIVLDAKEAALRMNEILKEAIFSKALTNDSKITASDAREINNYIVEKYADEWKTLKDRYSKIEKYGEIKALNKNAINKVWGRIYNIGFERYDRKYLANKDAKRSISFPYVAYLLDEVVDKDSLKNSDFKEVVGTTNTSLDKIVGVILNDRGLNNSKNTDNTTSDLRAGAYYADKMNHLLIEGIKATGIANDGHFTPADIRTLNNYLVENYEQEWATLHGDDEDDEESGYHRVQNDGATTRMFGENVINTIADGIYHLGYKTDLKNRLVNEDGNANQTFEDVAWWLEISLKEDIKAGKFANPDFKEVVGETGTSLDKIIPIIYNEEGLLRKVSMDDIREAARCANEMNKLLVEAIKETGVAEDRYISTDDVKTINKYLVANHATEWAELHGDDEDDEETGFHRIQNDGAVSYIEGKNLINTVADGIYHLGYETKYTNNLVNEDGNKNVTFYSVSFWLNKYLKDDLQNGKLIK